VEVPRVYPRRAADRARNLIIRDGSPRHHAQNGEPRLLQSNYRPGHPCGYSFNLDGTSIYLTIAALFIAQATNTHLSLSQEAFVLFILMLNSKGAAAVTGGGFITLAATLAALGTIPVAGITLLLGVDRFMSEMRSLVNLVGNGVATIVVSRWEGQFDATRASYVLSREYSKAEDEHQLSDTVATM